VVNRSTLNSRRIDSGGVTAAHAVKGVGDHLLEVASPATTDSSPAVIPGYVAVAKATIAAMEQADRG
jgi:hypothetical protein